MTELADRPSIVTATIFDLLTLEMENLGFKDVFYGDQEKLPRTPAACVEAAPFDRSLGGVGGKGRTDNILRVGVIIYFGKIQDVQINSKATEEMAEAVMDLLHRDVTLAGLVTHSFVTSIQPGYSARPDAILKASRVNWQGQSKTQIK